MKLVDMGYWDKIHEGETLFMVGCGPSLTYDKLDMLQGHTSMSMNNIALAYPHTEWRPTYYLNVTRSFYFDDYWQKAGLEAIKSAECSFIWARNAVPVARAQLNKRVSLLSCHTMPIWSSYADANVSRYGTSMFAALHVAYFMGFKSVYLLGCDLDYAKNTDFENKKEGYHFSSDYYGALKSEKIDYRRLILDEVRTVDAHSIANLAFRKRGARIYTTSHSMLETMYMYVPLEKALEKDR